YANLPLSFEANQGQSDSAVKWLSRGHGYSVFLTSTEAVLVLSKGTVEDRESTVLRMRLAGANAEPGVSGVDELPGKSNYFIGSDPAKWRTNIPTYAKVRYRDVYSGIDLVYYGNGRQLENDFVVSAGADPSVIRVGFEGSRHVSMDSDGNLDV